MLKRLLSAPCVALHASNSCIPVSDCCKVPAPEIVLMLHSPVLTLYSAEVWGVTSELGFRFIICDRAVAHRDVLGVCRIKAGQWCEVEIA